MTGSETSWEVPAPQGAGRNNGLRSVALVVLGVLLAALVGGIGLFVGLGMSNDDSLDGAPQTAAPVTAEPVAATSAPEPTEEEPDELANDELAEVYGDSVLKVEVAGCQTEGWGSAWVLDDRHLVTNWHVVSVDPTPDIVGRDGRTRLQGTVIGGHLDPDVAVIRVDKGQLPDPLPWADTDDLREGQEIVSLGYPAPVGDFSVTPSTIISFQRSGTTREAIRGDGALDRGNSGGPALTREGAVAGVATLMVQEANQLQMVPLLFTTDALRTSVERILADPQQVEPECESTVGTLPDDWAPDFDDWSSEGPQAYGDDASLDALYDACGGGDLAACDDLWMNSPYGSEYEAFAMSCGGSSVGPAFGSCQSQAEWDQQEQERAEEEAQREAEAEAEDRRQQEESAAALATLVSSCQGGDMQACDDLQREADFRSAEYDVAESCGGHYPEGWSSCVDREAEAAELQQLVGACSAGDMQACDDLWWAAGSGTPEEAVADDCGGRFPGGGGMCVFRQENP